MGATILTGLLILWGSTISLGNYTPEGKQRTGRVISLRVLVQGTPEEIFELWTSNSGVSQFYGGSDANIRLEKGGPYEIFFLPRDHPESRDNSSATARILDFERPGRLVFEWTAPPFAKELDTDPLPQWVLVTFTEEESVPGYTTVQLQHHGFGRSAQWDAVYEFFVTAWSGILYRLDRLQAM